MQEKVKHFEEEESIDILGLLFTLLKRWKIILLVFILVSSFGLFKVHSDFKNQVPVYVSATKVSLGPDILEVKSSQGEIIERKYSIDDEIEFLRSDTVAQKSALVLKEKFKYNESLDKLANSVKKAFNRGRQLIASGLSGRSTSSVVRGSVRSGNNPNTITIAAYTNSPQRSYDMVSALIEGYERAKAEEEAKVLEKMNKAFSEQAKAAYNELLGAENVLAEFIIENKKVITAMKAYNLTDQEDKDIVSDLLNEKYIEIKDDITELEMFLKSVENLAGKDKIAALSLIGKEYPEFVDLKLKDIFIDKEEELNKLLQINEEAHPAVIQIRGALESIRDKMDGQIENARTEIVSKLDLLKQSEQELSDLIASGLYEKLISYNMLKKDVMLKRQAYNSLNESLYQVDLGEKLKRYTELRILEPHKLPRIKSNKINAKDIISPLFLAIFLSIGVAYGLDKLDVSIKDVDQLEKVISLPILATIPAYSQKEKKER